MDGAMNTASYARLLPLAALLAACASNPVPPPVAPAPVAACLTMALPAAISSRDVYDRDVEHAVRASFDQAMSSAGFNLVADGSLPHDLVARIEVDPGSRLESRSKVRAVLVLEHEGREIDRIEAAGLRDAAGFDADVADALVDAVFRSPKLAAFTKARRGLHAKDHLAAPALTLALAARQPTAPPRGEEAARLDATAPIAPAAAPRAEDASPFVAGPAQPGAYAFIVGVDDYRSAPRVTGARADAERFAELARSTLGVADNHMKLLLGAKADKLAFDLTAEWLKLNVPAGGRVYFFFSGNGALRRRSITEYLLPADGDPRALDRTAVALPAFLQALSQTRAKEIVAIVDAGFSGVGARTVSSGEGAAAPAAIGDPEVAPRVTLITGVTSADTAGDDRASSGGLFTRWITEGLGHGRADIDGDGAVTVSELVAWVAPRVSRAARRDNRAQTPMVHAGPSAPHAGAFVLASQLAAE
jgi:hypothetical protein